MTHKQSVGLYNREQVYALDRLVIEADAQPGLQLMYRAALSVWRNIQRRWPETSDMLVLAGAGNNGGDAYAVACLARDDGVKVQVVSMGDLKRQSEESAHFRQWWLEAGGTEQAWDGTLPDCDLLVDGLLGIGLNKKLDKKWQALIAAINEHPTKRVAIDIPSGLNADTGSAQPVAVRAGLTVSFIGRKIGCYIGDGPDFCGERVFEDLGLSKATARRIEPLARTLEADTITPPPARQNNSHKNSFGHVLVVGGAPEFAGAAHLAGDAALRIGAGLVSLCVHPDSIKRYDAGELMVKPWAAFADLAKQASVILVGPGLGQSDEAVKLLKKIGKLTLPMIIDADALLAEFLDGVAGRQVVMTPHPGEAARLLEMKAAAIQQDRPAALNRLIQRWGLVTVLKGSGTLVAAPGSKLSVCTHGHAGMASAGMGDVLAGIIAGLVAQGLPVADAARAGVLIHALAAERFAESAHADSLIASDVSAAVGEVMSQVARLCEVN